MVRFAISFEAFRIKWSSLKLDRNCYRAVDCDEPSAAFSNSTNSGMVDSIKLATRSGDPIAICRQSAKAISIAWRDGALLTPTIPRLFFSAQP